MPKTPLDRVRITVAFSPDARDWLAAEAARRSVTIADLIRRLVDEARGNYVVTPRPR